MFSFIKFLLNLSLFCLLILIQVSEGKGTGTDKFFIGGGYVPDNPMELGKYVVHLREKNEKSFGASHFCSGSLLAKRIVLTAAHCLTIPGTEKIRPANSIVVHTGVAQRTKKTAQVRTYNVASLILFGDWISENEGDIGIVRTSSAVEIMKGYCELIKLPTSSWEVGDKCVTLGFGSDTEKGPLSEKLNHLSATLLSRKECAEKYPSEVSQHVICGVAPKATDSPCTGDAGGPLLCGGNKLVGISSFSHNCGKAGDPAVYTDVYSFYKWIMERGIGTRLQTLLSFYIFFTVFIYWIA